MLLLLFNFINKIDKTNRRDDMLIAIKKIHVLLVKPIMKNENWSTFQIPQQF